MSFFFLNVGAVLTLWGVLWFLWDYYAAPVPWLLGIGLCFLILGAIAP